MTDKNTSTISPIRARRAVAKLVSKTANRAIYREAPRLEYYTTDNGTLNIRAGVTHEAPSMVACWLQAEGLNDDGIHPTISIVPLDPTADQTLQERHQDLFGPLMEEGWLHTGCKRLWHPRVIQHILHRLFGGQTGTCFLGDAFPEYGDLDKEYTKAYDGNEGVRDIRSYAGSLAAPLLPNGYIHNEPVLVHTNCVPFQIKGQTVLRPYGSDGSARIHPAHWIFAMVSNEEPHVLQWRGMNPARGLLAKGILVPDMNSSVIHEELMLRVEIHGEDGQIIEKICDEEDFDNLPEEMTFTDEIADFIEDESREHFSHATTHRMTGKPVVLCEDWRCFNDARIGVSTYSCEVDGKFITFQLEIRRREFAVITADTLSFKGPHKARMKARNKASMKGGILQEPVEQMELCIGIMRDFSLVDTYKSGFQIISWFDLDAQVPGGKTGHDLMSEILMENQTAMLRSGPEDLIRQASQTQLRERTTLAVADHLGYSEIANIPSLSDCLHNRLDKQLYANGQGLGAEFQGKVCVIDDLVPNDNVIFDRKGYIDDEVVVSRYPVVYDNGITVCKVRKPMHHQLVRTYRTKIWMEYSTDGENWSMTEVPGDGTANGKPGRYMTPEYAAWLQEIQGDVTWDEPELGLSFRIVAGLIVSELHLPKNIGYGNQRLVVQTVVGDDDGDVFLVSKLVDRPRKGLGLDQEVLDAAKQGDTEAQAKVKQAQQELLDQAKRINSGERLSSKMVKLVKYCKRTYNFDEHKTSASASEVLTRAQKKAK